MPESPIPFEPATQVLFDIDDIILHDNNEVSLLYPPYTNSYYFKVVSDFISKCCLRESFKRIPSQYKEYLSEYWYTAKTLKNSKVWFLTPTWGILGEVGVTTFRNAIGANYLAYSTEYAEVPSLKTVRAWFSTIRYSGEHKIEGYENDNVTLNPTQIFSVHNWELKKNQPEGPPFTPPPPLMLAICNADKPVAFKAPITSSKAEKKVTQGTKPGANSDDTKKEIKLEDLSKLVLNLDVDFMDLDSPENEQPIIVEDKEEEEVHAEKDDAERVQSEEPKEIKDALASHPPSLRSIQLQELTNQVLLLQSQNSKLKKEMIKAKAEVAFLSAQPTYPNVEQLTELLVKSLSPELSELLSSHDFSSSLQTELKELPSKFNDLTREIKELKKHVYELKIELPGDLKEIPTKLEQFSPIVSSLTTQAKIKTLDVLPSQAGAHTVEGENNTKQATITQLFKQRTKKDAEKANMNQPPKPTTTPQTTYIPPNIPTTLQLQSPFLSSPPKSSHQPEGWLVKKYKGKKAMSFKDAEDKGIESEYDDDANLTSLMEQKRIEELVKAKLDKQEVEVGKEELVDLLGIDVLKCFYKTKLQYDKYCDKMLNIRVKSRIINCDVLIRKSPITLKVYREEGTNEIIPGFKASDLHLSERREVMQACLNRKGVGWSTIYGQIRTRIDRLHKTEAELEIDFSKPFSEQDPLDKLNDLARKKRKHADDIHDYFRSTKKFKSLVQYEDHLAWTVLNEPCLGMILLNYVQRQDFVTIEDFGDFPNDMLYTVQEILFRLH
ncbi:hypothetical protein Tco_0562540 [Tanacetum coccineum]